MARVTVEDCVEIIPNRFELVLLAARRTRELNSGSPMMVSKDNDKNPVIALREIADQVVDPEALRQNLIRSLQRFSSHEEDQILEQELLTALSHLEAEKSFAETEKKKPRSSLFMASNEAVEEEDFDEDATSGEEDDENFLSVEEEEEDSLPPMTKTE